MTPTDRDPSPVSQRTRYGLPTATVAAIAAYRAWQRDPIFVPPPSPGQLRLLVEYCYDTIHGSLYTYPAQELKDLRRRVVLLGTLDELAAWLWDCRQIGIEPL